MSNWSTRCDVQDAGGARGAVAATCLILVAVVAVVHLLRIRPEPQQPLVLQQQRRLPDIADCIEARYPSGPLWPG